MKKLFLVVMFYIINICFGQLVDKMHSTDHGKALTEDCLTCHICQKGEVPTASNPCLKQCSRPYQIRDTETQDIVIIDKLVEKYEPVIFMHGYHARMSSISGGCNNCHHFAPNIDDITSCGSSGCHDNESVVDIKISKPSLKGAYHRQCMGCHREWSHDTECAFCHSEIQEGGSRIASKDKSDIVGTIHPLIEAEPSYIYQTDYKDGDVVTFHHTDHVDVFGLSCTDCHKGDNCYRCHNTEKKGNEPTTIKHIETCCKCHTESNCSFCHSNDVKPLFNHDTSTDFVLGNYHKKLNCNQCHVSVKDFIIPTTSCNYCHNDWEAGVFEHSVTGLTLSETHSDSECEMCHIDREFAIEPNCENCHDSDVTFPEYSPGD